MTCWRHFGHILGQLHSKRQQNDNFWDPAITGLFFYREYLMFIWTTVRNRWWRISYDNEGRYLFKFWNVCSFISTFLHLLRSAATFTHWMRCSVFNPTYVFLPTYTKSWHLHGQLGWVPLMPPWIESSCGILPASWSLCSPHSELVSPSNHWLCTVYRTEPRPLLSLRLLKRFYQPRLSKPLQMESKEPSWPYITGHYFESMTS